MAVGEWDQRQLCPDGACVGVIGPDGTCKVCGRAATNWGDERKRGLIDPPDEDEQDSDDDEDDELAADDDGGDDEEYAAGDGDDGDDADDRDDVGDDQPGASARALRASSGDWSSRRLCPDGACIGVIGPNGRCKVCGRSASASADVGAAPAAVTASAVASADLGASAPATGGTASGRVGEPSATGGIASGRVGCADPACPGAIGADGHCDVCGKVAA